MTDHRSEAHPGSPPRVTFPRRYNAAADLLDRHVAEGRGDRVAYRDDRSVMSYARLKERACRAGNALAALGVAPEQRVLLLMLDTVDFPSVFLGAMRLGAVPVPINTLLTDKDYAFLLADSRARAVVVSDALSPKLEPALATLAAPPEVIVASSPLGGDRGAYPALDALLERASPSLEPAATTPDDVAFWLYSSGSTGAPKGAVHLHSHLMQTAVLYAQGVLGIREDDVVYSAAKLFFAYGLGNALTFPLSVGASAVLSAGRPTPDVVGSVMREKRPTIFGGVPTLFASLLANKAFVEGGISPELRVSISAGEALPKHVGEAWHERFGTDILDGIGSTEMLHIFLSNRHGDVRYGTSGKPVPGYELELRGDDGEVAGEGEEGSLWVRGPSAAAGYWNNRKKSLATFHGPWTRTGDRYVKDADGYYTYSGRADDMLKVGGIWVSPFEVESALSAHDGVLECAVVGHADDDQLVKPKAFVVLQDPAQASQELELELKAFVKGRLAHYKYPRWIEFIGELPKTATGKIQRYKLRG
jgi:benzoate-CoA ligase